MEKDVFLSYKELAKEVCDDFFLSHPIALEDQKAYKNEATKVLANTLPQKKNISHSDVKKQIEQSLQRLYTYLSAMSRSESACYIKSFHTKKRKNETKVEIVFWYEDKREYTLHFTADESCFSNVWVTPHILVRNMQPLQKFLLLDSLLLQAEKEGWFEEKKYSSFQSAAKRIKERKEKEFSFLEADRLSDSHYFLRFQFQMLSHFKEDSPVYKINVSYDVTEDNIVLLHTYNIPYSYRAEEKQELEHALLSSRTPLYPHCNGKTMYIISYKENKVEEGTYHITEKGFSYFATEKHNFLFFDETTLFVTKEEAEEKLSSWKQPYIENLEKDDTWIHDLYHDWKLHQQENDTVDHAKIHSMKEVIEKKLGIAPSKPN